jgi:hypothetical protein
VPLSAGRDPAPARDDWSTFAAMRDLTARAMRVAIVMYDWCSLEVTEETMVQ